MYVLNHTTKMEKKTETICMVKMFSCNIDKHREAYYNAASQ